MGRKFKEIEHKFLVRQDFDREIFFKKIKALNPTKVGEYAVEDTYFVVKGLATHVFRHRFDQEIEQLTVKSVEASSQVRTEINLNLRHGDNSQLDAVGAIVDVLGRAWSKTIKKQVMVAYLPSCEIVHYTASCGSRSVCCVEFEATGIDDLAEALPVLQRYEKLLGFASETAEKKSLFELLLMPDAPPEIAQMFLKKSK